MMATNKKPGFVKNSGVIGLVLTTQRSCFVARGEGNVLSRYEFTAAAGKSLLFV
jgi:hypothetical protein